MRMWKLISAAVALVVICATSAHAQSRQRGFSVVLLIGDVEGATSGDGLPPAPALRKALADVKDFLPYKSYRVLDTQWMRSGSSRMKGLADQEYEVEIAADELQRIAPFQGKPDMLNVVFKLQEAGTSPNEEFGRGAKIAEMQKQLDALRERLGDRHPEVLQLKSRMGLLEQQIRLARSTQINSRFEMAIGETVVVGTSRIGRGDNALVVLLTSVAAGK